MDPYSLAFIALAAQSIPSNFNEVVTCPPDRGLELRAICWPARGWELRVHTVAFVRVIVLMLQLNVFRVYVDGAAFSRGSRVIVAFRLREFEPEVVMDLDQIASTGSLRLDRRGMHLRGREVPVIFRRLRGCLPSP